MCKDFVVRNIVMLNCIQLMECVCNTLSCKIYIYIKLPQPKLGKKLRVTRCQFCLYGILNHNCLYGIMEDWDYLVCVAVIWTKDGLKWGRSA